MQLGWLALYGLLAVGCELSPVQRDDGRAFLGDWECDSGSRDIDCGLGVVVADLALGPPNLLRFDKGTATDLLLLIPSRGIVPGPPGGPTCELAFVGNADSAFLRAESTCVDDQGNNFVVHEGSARFGWRPSQIVVTTVATTSESCSAQTQALCYSAP